MLHLTQMEERFRFLGLAVGSIRIKLSYLQEVKIKKQPCILSLILLAWLCC